MKILQIIHKEQKRGAEIFTSQLSNHLTQLGHELKVVSLFKGEGSLPYLGIIECLNASPERRFTDWNAWKKLSSIVAEFQPDVVQTNAGDTLKYAVFSKRTFRWNCPITVRNASEVGRYLTSTPQKLLNNFLYRNVDQVISVSQASERDILNHFPFLQGKTKVIPVGLESNLNGIKKVSLEPKGAKHIIHVGGFSFEKNHKGLMRIFQSLLKFRTDLHLHLVGDGPLRAEIQNEIGRLGFDKKVTFYGFVDNPLVYIKAADVLVLPSVIEGLPGVLLEAMSCKTPVVAYDVGGIAEIVLPETGRLIESGEEQAFATAILDTLDSSATSRVENAFEIVQTKYMNTNIAQKFLQSYKKLLGINN